MKTRRILSFIIALFVFSAVIIFDYDRAYAFNPVDLDWWYGVIANDNPTPGQQMMREAINKSVTQDAGFIVGNLESWQLENTRKFVAKWLNKKYSTNKTENDVTDQDIIDCYNEYTQNISVTDNGLTYNDNSRRVINSVIETYKEECGFTYVYSLNLQYNLNNFPNGDLYNATRQKLNEVQGGKFCGLSNTIINHNSNWYLTVWDISKLGFVYSTNGNGNMTGLYECDMYDLTSWQRIEGSNRYNYMTQYEYDPNSKTFVVSSVINNTSTWNYIWVSITNNKSDFTYYYSSDPVGLNSDGTHTFKMYRTLADLKAESVGESPYYYNNTVYNNWSTSSGDYTVSVDNSNQVTYGDITSYVNSFNTENHLVHPLLLNLNRLNRTAHNQLYNLLSL